MASSLPSASQRSPKFISGSKTSLWGKVRAFLPLEETQKGDERLSARKTSLKRGSFPVSLSHINPLTAVYPVILPVTLGRFNPPHNLPVREC